MVINIEDPRHYEQDIISLSRFTQSYGLLIVLSESDLTIAQISSNVEDWFGLTPHSLLNQPLTALLSSATVQSLGDRRQQESGDFFYRFQFRKKVGGQVQGFHGLFRRYQTYLVVEVEPVRPGGQSPEVNYHGRFKTFVSQLKPEISFQGTAALIAQEVQQVTGFDRVLLFKFSEDGGGGVIAEAKKNPDSATSYDGLHFPAIDIPPIARRTFQANRLRMIVDLDAPQSALIPAINPHTNQPFEPIASILMGVSPCHIEYYHNMGVAASLVIALINGENLWGLIVGQHDTPKYLDPELRSYCDSLGYLMSLELPRQQTLEIRRYRQNMETILANLQTELQQVGKEFLVASPRQLSPSIPSAQGPPFSFDQRPEKVLQDLLCRQGDSLLTLVQAQGAVIYFGDCLTQIGQTPDQQRVKDLLSWLKKTSNYKDQDYFAIDCLSAVYLPGQEFTAIASGVLGIVIRLQNTAYYLLWFRPELTQTVKWAGVPSIETRLDEAGTSQLCPRKSFELWQESVQGKALAWHPAEVEVVKDLREILAQAALKLSQMAWEEAAEQARIANQSKSQFLAKMSHELRTPLNAILGFSQIMNQDENLSAEHQQHLKIINRSGEHLLSLINDVLEMSKIEAGRLSFNENPFNLNQVVEAIAEMLQLKASAKNLQLILEYDPRLPKYVITDEGKLRQVLINLLDNAIKFTSQGWVKLRVYQGDSPTHVFFEVSDTGHGIAPEEQHLLFDPFAQTESGRKSMQGAGLGLPICKQFVNLLGGELTIVSEVGKGSTFCFDLTLRLSEAIATPTAYQEKRIIGIEPGQPHYRILIVEDVEENRLLLFKLLSPLGFEIRAVNNGKEAIETWKVWQPHLIWMDILMPIMDGYEATKQIRALPGGTDVVIIALTANAFSDAQHAALSVGCNDYLPKPYQEGQIFELMAKHLALRYCYGKEIPAKPNSKGSQFVLTPQTLTVMPKSWLKELQTAALGMEEERLAELIAEIPPDHHNLAQNLTYLVENFRLDLILDLTHGDD